MRVITELEYIRLAQSLESDNQDLKILNLIQGDLENGEKAYVYLLSSPQEYTQLSIDEERGENIVIDNYGEVLFSGKNEVPPEYVKKAIENKYGEDEEVQESLDALKHIIKAL